MTSTRSSLATCKIKIFGPFGSGKTSLINTISEVDVVADPTQEAKGTMRQNTTVAMDFGRITSEDGTVVLYLFGQPAARRFDFMAEFLLTDGFLGFIMMIDSCHPETFCHTQSIFHTALSYGYDEFPCVFAANYQDDPNAWDGEALRMALQIDPGLPVVPCVATDHESVKRVLLTLLNEALKHTTEAP